MEPRSVKPVFAAGLVMLLVISALQMPGLTSLRKEHKLSEFDVVAEMPSEYAVLTTVLGGFRGLLADFLWLRTIQLEKVSKHFELVQLYDWIGMLEPRIPEIWLLNSHNLAYNISISMPDREDRWLWVQRGLELLRNKGLRYNPESYEIHLQIAWIYLHKIGGRADDYHWHFKTHLALRVQDTLGTLTPDINSIAAMNSAQTFEEFIKSDQALVTLVEKARSLEIDLQKAYGELHWQNRPLDKEQVRAVTRHAEAVNKIRQFLSERDLPLGWDFDKERVKMLVDQFNSLARSDAEVSELFASVKGLDLDVKRSLRSQTTSKNSLLSWSIKPLNDSQRKLVDEFPELVKKIRDFVSAKRLSEDWGLDTRRMLRLEEKYGVIDWRLADAHAFYWAGIANELTTEDSQFFETNRVFYFAFVNMFRKGKLFLEPEGGDYVYITEPEIRFARALHEHFLKAIEKEPLARKAHRDFLEELVQTLSSYSLEEDYQLEGVQYHGARWWYKKLGDLYGEDKFKTSYDDFILLHIAEDIRDANRDQTEAIIVGLIRQKYWWMAVGADTKAYGYAAMAKKVWNMWERSRTDPDKPRLAIKPLKKMEVKFLNDIFTGSMTAPFPALLRERLWERIGKEWQEGDKQE
ncbi:MAG: hypothetical protein O3B01_07390 [Planctomycetota bacterium]|nr:hypothetical protein [Planctomycetota bacterium]MDA1138393.1 hypothetical protein [Planctomycetota bacterium]